MITTLFRARKSTNVRTTQAPRPIRLAFRVLETAAPAISARWAEHLWFRLPRRARSRRPLEGGTPITVRVGEGRVHSLGATATAVALCDGLEAQRVVFLAPMASAAAYAHDLTVVLGAGRRTYRRLVRRIERRAGVALRHFEVPELGRAVVMPPTMVVHDRDDPSTDVADGEAIASAWSESRIHVTTGLGHRRIVRDPEVLARVVDFVGG